MNAANKPRKYQAIISSDWNQCLAPCGPFDPVIYAYPNLASDLTNIFKEYTSNKITLGTANQLIGKRLPEPLSVQQMDAYLDDHFTPYKGVPGLIDWCHQNHILFMINTTGTLGYFQRIFAKQLLPPVPVISANSTIRYPDSATDPLQIYNLHEIEDKGKNTARALEYFGILEKRAVLMGDSGGDGPHFEWGQNHGAYLVASMPKRSLMDYCHLKNIAINHLFGTTYLSGEERNETHEMLVDFMELRVVIERILENNG